MHKTPQNRIKRKRGISLLEAVICLTIITLVSGAFVSIAMIFSKAEVKNTTHLQAISYGESIVECFRYCKSKKDIESALTNLDASFVAVVPDDKSEGDATYRLEKTGYVINVVINFSQNKLEIQIADHIGNEISRLSYEKS